MNTATLNKINATEALKNWIPKSKSFYSSYRNFDIKNKQSTSGLSAFISSGLLSETDIFNKIVDHGVHTSSNKFIEEIFWRIYFRGYLENRPSIWINYLNEKKNLEPFKVDNNYISAVNSATGINCMDSWTKDLIQEGFLHNHVRMWYASIWIFKLKLPWQLGADFFLKNLADADEASNTLSWRWVAGLHTSKKPYIARSSNIFKYTQEFNLKSELEQNISPIKETFIHPLCEIDFSEHVPTDNVTMLIYDNFFSHLNSSVFKKVKNIYVVDSALDSSYRIIKNWKKTRSELLDELSKKFNVKLKKITVEDISSINESSIITNRPRVGFWRDKLLPGFNGLVHSGQLTFLIPEIDRLSWPHCKGGFFKLKDRIKKILNQMNRQTSLFQLED